MKRIYLILAALMLLCLAPMPYGYFQLVRFVAMVVFGVMAYRYYINNKKTAAVVLGVLALLFQPIYKVVLGRGIWNVIDVVVALFLVALFFVEKRQLTQKPVKKLRLTSNDQGQMDDNKIEFHINSRLSPKELVYVASEEDKSLTELFETHPEVLEGWGKMIGFHIVYLPLLIKRLRNKSVLQYRAPYLSDAELADVTVGNDFLLQYLDNPDDRKKIKQGFIRTEDVHRGDDGKDKALNRFYPLSSTSGEPLADQLLRIGKQISQERSTEGRYLDGRTEEFDGRDSNDGTDGFGADNQNYDSSTEELMQEVRDRISKLRQRGIAEYILEQLIHPDNRLSRMLITNDYRILLPDYNDMEIKMEPLTKAVYFLFLRHPEGIVFKRLPDYREELTNIYEELKPSGLTERAIRSIEDVTNPVLNSINEKCARIRASFVGQFDEYMAEHYYIKGQRAEAKKISLPRDLVVWE